MRIWLVGRLCLTACWIVWFYPFVFRAPHRQRRNSITMAGPTRIGLAFECVAVALASLFQRGTPPGPALFVSAFALAIASSVLGWRAVAHLGRQFRINAGLYEDHELVRSGPYAFVRHPIYASLLGMLLVTFLLLTPWQIAIVSLSLFVVGTEIRVRTEDGLLLARFGPQFREYRKQVPAYIPFLR